jgi:SAM-dependent methyltransferase
MQPCEYETMRRMEDCHWWYDVLRNLVMESLTVWLKPEAHVLDAGCGTGGMMARMLQQPWYVEGIDLDPRAVQASLLRGLAGVQQADVSCLPFDAMRFGAVLSLDVLYHQAVNQETALVEMLRVLKPGGLLILNLPAFDCLRGAHDKAVCGVRRYKACHVRQMLQFHNMEVEILHSWNASLFLPILLHRIWSRFQMRQSSDLRMPPMWLNAMLIRLGRLDARVCRLAHLPFGTSWFVVARKAL